MKTKMKSLKVRKHKHYEWELEKYSDKEFTKAIQDYIINAADGNAWDGIRPTYDNRIRLLCREAIRRIDKYKKSANCYRRNYYDLLHDYHSMIPPELEKKLARNLDMDVTIRK